MSFAKAKIQRFNDVKVCTPSPAKNPASAQKKLKFGFMKKHASPPCSEVASVQSTPCFQTPTVPKKKKFLGLSSSKSKTFDLEELKDKIVECNNKDMYIKEMTDQIEDMRTQISTLQEEKAKLNENHTKTTDEIKNQHTKKLEDVRTKIGGLHNELKRIRHEYDELKNENCLEIAKLYAQITKLEDQHSHNEKLGHQNTELIATVELIKTQHQRETEEWQIQKAALIETIENIKHQLALESSQWTLREHQTIDDLKQKHADELARLKQETIENLATIEEVQNQHAEALETMKQSHGDAIKRLQSQNYETVESIKELHMVEIDQLESEVARLHQLNETLRRSDSVAVLKSLQQENSRCKAEVQAMALLLKEKEAEIKLLQENFQDVHLLTDMQMSERVREIDNTWKARFALKEKELEAILKECQEISEYNIIQSELEKNQLKILLAEKESVYDSLKIEYDEFVEKYKNQDISASELLRDLRDTRRSLRHLKNEKHAYEISIGTFKDTIEVLKRRLISSDRDVEQFKDELTQSESRQLEQEIRIGELSAQLRESQAALEELEMQYESTSRLMQGQVTSIERELLLKVEALEAQLKAKTSDDRQVLERVLEQQSLTDRSRDLISQSRVLIETLEADNIELENANLDLQVGLENLKIKLVEESQDGAEIRKRYIEKSGKYDELSHQFEQLLQELDKVKEKNCELERKMKSTKKIKFGDKENVASPKRVIRVESPGPLREKN